MGDETDASTSREVWGRNRLYVTVSRTILRNLRIEGQDLNPNPFGSDEYEYALTVNHGDIPKIIEALGGQEGDDPIDLIEANAETIVNKGEMSWLKSIGIEPGFWSHF